MIKEITLDDVQKTLLSFVEEQRKFNKGIDEKVDGFVVEQRAFNIEIDKKIDKAQYFLEEALATNTKMFFEEQLELKSYVKDLESEVESLKEDILDLNTRFNLMFKAS